MSKRAYGKYERRENDLYPTPLKSVRPLIPHLRAAGVRDFCEPCCGLGDLIVHLESFRLRCVYAGDIVTGQNALDVPRFEAGVITNPPYPKKEDRDGYPLVPLVAHFIETAPFVWLLLKADFAHVKYSRPFWPQCSDIVTAKREAHMGEGSGMENASWFRFERSHRTGPIFHNGDGLLVRRTCAVCDGPIWGGRSDAKTCSDRCRQTARRSRLIVGQP